MSNTELDRLMQRLADHPGVEQLVLLGADGLTIEQTPRDAPGAETVAARAPGLAAAAAALGRAVGAGDFATAALEFGNGVAIIAQLPEELLLAAVLRPEVGFATFLREVRRERDRLVELL